MSIGRAADCSRDDCPFLPKVFRLSPFLRSRPAFDLLFPNPILLLFPPLSINYRAVFKSLSLSLCVCSIKLLSRITNFSFDSSKFLLISLFVNFIKKKVDEVKYFVFCIRLEKFELLIVSLICPARTRIDRSYRRLTFSHGATWK